MIRSCSYLVLECKAQHLVQYIVVFQIYGMVRKINQARCCCVVPRDDYGPRTVLSNRTQVSLSCTHVVKWARIYLRHYYLERAGLLDLFLHSCLLSFQSPACN